MGFMDKVKSAAQDAASQAKVATSQAQAKIEQTQLQSKLDGLAKQLGYAVYNERANGAPAGGIDGIVEEMRGIEAQIAGLAQPSASASPAATSTPESPVTHTDAASSETSASEPTSGDFKL
ncbi:MAG: hypothetical protein KY391_05895 [Actinobacteria bacterium]|nr:hypothetical protein [Actinomycetota bacterium]